MIRLFFAFFFMLLVVRLVAQFDEAPPPMLDNGATSNERYVIFQENGKYGYRNGEGKIIVAAHYDQLSPEPWVLMPVKKEGKPGIINFLGETVVAFGEYDLIAPHQSIPMKKSATDNGVLYFQEPENIGFLVKKGSRYGLINPVGLVLLPIEFIDFKYLNLNTYAFLKEEKWGIYTSIGQQLWPHQYDRVDQAHIWNKCVIVEQNGKKGMVRLPDEALLETTFDIIAITGNNKYEVWQDGNKGYFDPKTGKIEWTETGGLKPLEHQEYLGYSGKYYRIYDPNTLKYGLGHPEKGTVLASQFTFADRPLFDSLFQFAAEENNYALFDGNGKALTSSEYIAFKEAENGEAVILAIQKNRRWMLLDLLARPITGETYQTIQNETSSGYFYFIDNAKFAVGNPDGTRLTGFKYAFREYLGRSMFEYVQVHETLMPGRKLVAAVGLEDASIICIDNTGAEVKCMD